MQFLRVFYTWQRPERRYSPTSSAKLTPWAIHPSQDVQTTAKCWWNFQLGQKSLSNRCRYPNSIVLVCSSIHRRTVEVASLVVTRTVLNLPSSFNVRIKIQVRSRALRAKWGRWLEEKKILCLQESPSDPKMRLSLSQLSRQRHNSVFFFSKVPQTLTQGPLCVCPRLHYAWSLLANVSEASHGECQLYLAA